MDDCFGATANQLCLAKLLKGFELATHCSSLPVAEEYYPRIRKVENPSVIPWT